MALLTVNLAGCASGKGDKPLPAMPGQTLVEPSAADATQESDYIIQQGDVLDVKFAHNPEINEHLVVRPDGKISLLMVEEIKAAGMRPADLAKLLAEKYARVLQEPELTVIVREFAGMKVYVGGEVYTPRVLSLSGEMTALQAIMGAGGFNDKAKLSSVIIVSRSANNRPTARRVDLARVLAGNPQSSDPLLHPFDVVYVPKTFIAQANKFVEQYIEKMIPGNLSGGFSYTVWKGVP